MSPAMYLPSRRFLLLSASAVVTAILTGCGAGALDHGASGSLKLTGTVHGGQQPVSGSIIRLYAAGTGGNGTAAVDMLKVASLTGTVDYVTSDGSGSFSITGDYTCANANDQIYITASNGNPGLPNPNGSNPALVMMTALGNCSGLFNQTSYPFITINEVTTVAAVYALAPFMTSAANVASSATNSTGIVNAFLDANLLVDPATGIATTLPANLSAETGKLYALANVIAACVNSDGTSGGCTQLFGASTPPGGTAPTNTLTAALDVVRNPSHNVAAIFQNTGTQPPFSTDLVTAPNDWTMSLSITGGALSQPTAVSIDTLGNVWVADYLTDQNNFIGGVSAFSPQGVSYASGFGFGSSGSNALSEVFGLTVDLDNNVWATNQENGAYGHVGPGSVALLFGATSGKPLGSVAGVVSDPSIYYPESLATDTNHTIIIGNYANSSATVYVDSGGFQKGGLGSGYATLPTAITADGNHGVWFANNGTTTVTHVDTNGVLIATTDCCNGGNGIARDSAGNVWVSNYYGSDYTVPGSFSELTDAGAVLINQRAGGGLSHPAGVQIDASQNVWVANYYGGTITEISGSTSPTPGTFLSPDTGLGLDAQLLRPFAVAPDASGNMWVSSYGNSKLVMFFGLATPTATPAGPAPLAP